MFARKENNCCLASTDMYDGIWAGDDSQSAKLQRFSTFVMLEDKAWFSDCVVKSSLKCNA